MGLTQLFCFTGIRIFYQDADCTSWLFYMCAVDWSRLKATQKMYSFITEPQMFQALKRVGSRHAGCRNVHQTCWAWLESSFHYRKISSMYFPKVLQYNCSPFVTLPGQDLHIRHLLSETATWPADATAGCKTKDFKLLENISGKLICLLVVFTTVLIWQQLIIVTEWANADLWWCLALWRSVLFRDESLRRADGRCMYTVPWASRLLMSTLWTCALWWLGVVVWAGIIYA